MRAAASRFVQRDTLRANGPTGGPGPGLRAGVARIDVTHTGAGPISDPLYAKALVVTNGITTVVLITVDAVAIGEIGPIGSDYLPNVRARLGREFGVAPANVVVSASHCHGIVCDDVEERTVEAVRQAWSGLVPVAIGVGVGHEDRISENRRPRLKSGADADVRRAYSLPPDEDVLSTGPIDPRIGVLRLDRPDGRTLAVVYSFACHPIMGVPSGGNTADIPGFASRAIEDSLGGGAIALFLQGCAGDVNPALYKNVDAPRNADMLGSLLGLSTLKALSGIRCAPDERLIIFGETLRLPAADLAPHIERLRGEQTRLTRSLKGTNLNLKTFLQLASRYGLSPRYPSHYSYRYLHERESGREDLARLDQQNRGDLAAYVHNIHTMEQLTRLETNLELLQKHQARIAAGGQTTIDAELTGLRIGEWVLIAFPGELSVQIGLNIRAMSPHAFTFVAGCTNGYLYYAPTAEQLANAGGAQEDSDCLLAPEWQALFESRVADMLRRL